MANIGAAAGSLTGGTGFGGGDRAEVQGEPLIDYDEVVDRNEELVLLLASHQVHAMPNSTETADGTVRAYVEISAQPTFSQLNGDEISIAALEGDATGGMQGEANADDTIDLIGPALQAWAGAPFSDGTTGVGGGGSAGEASWQSDMFPAEYGRFHPRDELFLNASAEVWNIDDAGVHIDVAGQHVYGVLSDE